MCVCVFVYINIYIYIYKSKERSKTEQSHLPIEIMMIISKKECRMAHLKQIKARSISLKSSANKELKH